MMENQYDSGIILTLDFLTNYCGYYDFDADEYVCLHDNPPDRLDDGRGMCMAGGCPVANQVKETRNCEGDQPMEVFDQMVLSNIQSSCQTARDENGL